MKPNLLWHLSLCSYHCLIWLCWIPISPFLVWILVDPVEKIYIGFIIPLDLSDRSWIYDPIGFFGKPGSPDLRSHWIPAPDPWDRILGSIFGIRGHVCTDNNPPGKKRKRTSKVEQWFTRKLRVNHCSTLSYSSRLRVSRLRVVTDSDSGSESESVQIYLSLG